MWRRSPGLVQTSPDRVREMIQRFNDLGMHRWNWVGGWPARQITTSDRGLIVETAKTGQTRGVARSRTGRSASSSTTGRPRRAGRCVWVGNGCDRSWSWRASRSADQDVEGVARSVEGGEAGSDRAAASNMSVTARSRSMSSGRSRSSRWAERRGRRTASPSGCGRTTTSRMARGSSTFATRSVRISWPERSNRARDPCDAARDARRSGPVSMTAGRSTSSWTTSTTTRP